MRWVILFGSLFVASTAVIGVLIWSLWKRSRLLVHELMVTAEAFDEVLAASQAGRVDEGAIRPSVETYDGPGSPELRGPYV